MTSVALTTREASGAWDLQYEGPGDASGLVFLLGTNYLRAPFSNPAASGGGAASGVRGSSPRLAVTVSSLDEYSADPRVICSRHCDDGEIDATTGHRVAPPVLRTKWDSALPAWVQVDFGIGCSMKILRYSLRSGSNSFGSDTMVDWELQGRVAVGRVHEPTTTATATTTTTTTTDPRKADLRRGGHRDERCWVVLSKHVGDNALLEASRRRGRGAIEDGWASWVVWDQDARTVDVDAIRIVMVSPNSSGNARLALADIEVYGMFTDWAHPSH